MIEEGEVEEAQKRWAEGVVHIGAAPTWEEAVRRTETFLRSAYHLEKNTLLFCPTKAAETQFRSTIDSARSYFVGGDPDHPEDRGFALEPWASIRFVNHGVVNLGDVALAMGNYFFSRHDGTDLKVEYSLAYFRDLAGSLKIQLHHSALPYRT